MNVRKPDFGQTVKNPQKSMYTVGPIASEFDILSQA